MYVLEFIIEGFLSLFNIDIYRYTDFVIKTGKYSTYRGHMLCWSRVMSFQLGYGIFNIYRTQNFCDPRHSSLRGKVI